MQKFYKHNANSNDLQTVKDLLDSIMKNKLVEELINEYHLEENSKNHIEINYFSYVLSYIRKINKEYEKLDLKILATNIRCVDIIDESSALFTIENIPDDKISFFGKKDIKIQSKRSVKKDYLDLRFSANKFISYLKLKNKEKLMSQTLEDLEENFKIDSKLLLRIVRKTDENQAYIRAIASTEYEDYNLNYSIVLLYILLEKLRTKHELKFTIEEIIIDDSHIVVSVSSSKQIKLQSGAYLTFSIEMVNDEIKRDACKFFTVMHIIGKDFVLNLKPLKSSFLSINHKKNRLSNVIRKIEEAVDDISSSIDLILNQSKHIDSIKKPDQIKDFIYSKIIDKRSPFSQKDREKISNELNKQSANSVVNLLEMLGKIDLLMEDEEIQSREYWRNLLYKALIKKGQP